jgi:capsular polysaccharide biosynthesis protein
MPHDRRDEQVPVTDESQTSPRRGALQAALRHSAVLILVLAATGTVLGAAAGFRRAEDHTARASILVSPLTGNPFYPSGRGDDLINLETEAQLVRSDPVAREVATRLGDDITTAGLLSGLDVSVPANTQILTIEYTASSDTDALRRAQGFADAYLDYRKTRSEQVVRSRSKRIQDQVDDQNRTLSSLVARSNVETNVANKNLLQEQINGVTTQIGQLQAQLAELQTGAVDPGQVITPANVVGGSSLGVIALYAFVGLLAALALGLGVVVVRARAENRIHHADDITASGLPLLGSISMNEVLDTNQSIGSSDGSGDVPIGPGLQTLRVSVLSRERGRPLRILYASAAEGSPSPRAALGLAYATASSSLATVLVDATSGSGEITELVGLTDRPGFTDVLAGDVDLHKALTSVSAHLLVLPAGRLDERVDDLLTGPLVGTLFGQLGQIADVQIIATGPMHSPRSQALAMVTDVTLVEAVEGQSRLGDLVAITDEPTLAESLLGVVFVGRARSRSRKSA